MLFNSLEYVYLFLPITVLLYFYLNSKRLTEAAKGLLVFSSLFFYSWWDIRYLPLILGSILFNYVIGVTLSGTGNYRKPILLTGIACNLALLGLYKYADFFIANTNTAFGTGFSLLHLALPLAISFFTFQQITFIVDSYYGKTKETDFLNYAVFVTFFPQLIAGPIVHHSEMMPQFKGMRGKVVNYTNISRGLFIFSMGLFKKVIIADSFAVYATKGFDTVTTLNFMDAWVTSISYTMQIYFDFSGYTDMAIGSALLMNIKLPINFNSPYKSLDIQDFWRRWHITLSRFLRDYVYIPLGGNRRGEVAVYRNLFITFLVGGLWHGAGWTFVFWGCLHGMAIMSHRVWKRFFRISMPKALAWFVTFNFINVTWVFFRAREWDDALKVINGMFFGAIGISNKFRERLSFIEDMGLSLNYIEHSTMTKELVGMILLYGGIMLFFRNSMEITKDLRPNKRTIAYGVALLIYGLLSVNRISEFLYFNF